MTLEEFNSKYVYKTDKDKFGFIEVWEIPELQDGIYYGDCEDYCIFLKKNIEEFADWDYYYCKINGNGHCVLIKDNQVICCNIKTVIDLEVYNKLYNVTDLKRYNLFTLVSKLIIGKLLKLISKVKA